MPNPSLRAPFVAMLTLGGGLLAGVGFVEPAHAQYYGPSYYGPFFGNFFPHHRPRMRPRVRRFSHSYERPRYERRPVARRLHPQPTLPALPATAPAPRKLEKTPTWVGLVIGDTMADWLAYGLEEAFAETPEIGVVRKIKGSVGLAGNCNGELQAWLQDSLAVEKAEKLAFVAIMIGTADRRPIRNCPVRAEGADSKAKPGAAQTFPFHSDEWSALYAARVGDVVSVLKSKGVPVHWVGLPPLRNVRDADIEVLNDIYEARAEKAGVKFIEVWDSFVDESGDYAVRGPDINGQTRRLRASDGTYFTKAGARKLAWHLEKEIKPIMAAHPQVATPAPEPSAGAPADKRAPRPVAGPVVPLDTFTTPSKPEPLVGGVRNSSTDSVAGRVPNNREQPPAEIRRADDFTWPRRQAQSPGAETQLEGAPQSPRPDREGPSARD